MTADEFDRPEPVFSDTPQPTRDNEPEAVPPEADTAKLEAEIAELKDRLLRALAEVENIRRRSERERDETRKYAITGFARDLLQVADNLGRALAAVPLEARGKDPAVDGLMSGVELTDRELRSVFERHGIRRIDPIGERFDHNFHQAMMEVEDPTKPPGTVVQVLQTGYVIQDRLLRAAMVAVSRGGKAEPAAPKAANQDVGHTLDTKA
jgi:molecular chaperone GrpE